MEIWKIVHYLVSTLQKPPHFGEVAITTKLQPYVHKEEKGKIIMPFYSPISKFVLAAGNLFSGTFKYTSAGLGGTGAVNFGQKYFLKPVQLLFK
ncbi:MAG: hypothetical protein ACLSGF_06140 [Alistipes onderdonkii]